MTKTIKDFIPRILITISCVTTFMFASVIVVLTTLGIIENLELGDFLPNKGFRIAFSYFLSTMLYTSAYYSSKTLDYLPKNK